MLLLCVLTSLHFIHAAPPDNWVSAAGGQNHGNLRSQNFLRQGLTIGRRVQALTASTPRDLHGQYDQIFPHSNRNAASHLWACVDQARALIAHQRWYQHRRDFSLVLKIHRMFGSSFLLDRAEQLTPQKLVRLCASNKPRVCHTYCFC